MRRTTVLLRGALGLWASLAGCTQDVVHPGFYGEPEMAEQPITGAPPASGAGGVTFVGGGAGGMPTLGTGGQSAPVSSDGGVPLPDGSPCDLGGRWLLTLHTVTDAIGQFQTIHRWLYYEIERTDGGHALTKGLLCGDEGVAEGAFAVKADFSPSWQAAMERVSFIGREVRSLEGSGGCNVHVGRWYTVKGATTPHYTDPGIPLPGPDQPASGSTPGWEDWDGDGNPGITGSLTGSVVGKVFVAPRLWTELSGTVADTGAGTLRLGVQWDQEPNLVGYDGSPILTSQAVRAADPNLHFAEMARLQPGQAVGDDASICAAVRELAATLTPNANAI